MRKFTLLVDGVPITTSTIDRILIAAEIILYNCCKEVTIRPIGGTPTATIDRNGNVTAL